jgi:hypothetical protein
VWVVLFSRTADSSLAACDKPFLTNLADQYLASMVKSDPTGLPLAPGYKFTENIAATEIGEGPWVGASEIPTKFKIYAADPTSKQGALYGVTKNSTRPLSWRFGSRWRKEKSLKSSTLLFAISARSASSHQAPRAGLVETITLIRCSKSDGNLAPYADDCVRHENGMQTTTNTAATLLGPATGADENPAMAKLLALGCHDSINTHELSYITKIPLRRLIVIDEERDWSSVFRCSVTE